MMRCTGIKIHIRCRERILAYHVSHVRAESIAVHKTRAAVQVSLAALVRGMVIRVDWG